MDKNELANEVAPHLRHHQFRMLNEYNSEVEMTTIGSRTARWIDTEQLIQNR